jgi:hypothetical protein
MRALRFSSVTLPGSLLIGAAGAFAFAAVIAGATSWFTGGLENRESAAAAYAAAIAIVIAVVLTAIAAIWGLYVASVLRNGARSIAEVLDVTRGRYTHVLLEINGRRREVVIIGPSDLLVGEAAVVRHPVGRARPLLLENAFQHLVQDDAGAIIPT